MKPKMTDAELEVMKVVWDKNPITANEIYKALEKTTNWGEPTVRTLIGRLTKKKFLLQEKKEIYYYSPAISENKYMKEQTKTFLNKVYGGKAKKLVASLFEDDYLSSKDIDELKEFWNKGEEKNE